MKVVRTQPTLLPPLSREDFFLLLKWAILIAAGSLLLIFFTVFCLAYGTWLEQALPALFERIPLP